MIYLEAASYLISQTWVNKMVMKCLNYLMINVYYKKLAGNKKNQAKNESMEMAQLFRKR